MQEYQDCIIPFFTLLWINIKNVAVALCGSHMKFTY